MTVLVVDDDVGVRLLLLRTLALRGHEVIAAKDGTEAISLASAAAEAPSLVFMDVLLEQESGIDCARRLRSLLPGLKTVFITGSLQSADAARDSGLGRVLLKPFSIADVYTIADLAAAASSRPIG